MFISLIFNNKKFIGLFFAVVAPRSKMGIFGSFLQFNGAFAVGCTLFLRVLPKSFNGLCAVMAPNEEGLAVNNSIRAIGLTHKR